MMLMYTCAHTCICICTQACTCTRTQKMNPPAFTAWQTCYTSNIHIFINHRLRLLPDSTHYLSIILKVTHTEILQCSGFNTGTRFYAESPRKIILNPELCTLVYRTNCVSFHLHQTFGQRLSYCLWAYPLTYNTEDCELFIYTNYKQFTCQTCGCSGWHMSHTMVNENCTYLTVKQ
jgi:hypothetical protein